MDYTNPGIFSSPSPRSSSDVFVQGRLRNAHASPTPQLRRSFASLPRLDWERFRSIITQLYIDRDFQLKPLVNFMQKRHGFCATEQMYKKKFALWKLRKYYTRYQKARLVEQLAASHSHSILESLPEEVNLQPVKLQRIERYLRQQRHHQEQNPRRRRRTRSACRSRSPSIAGPLGAIMTRSPKDPSDDASQRDLTTEDLTSPDAVSAMYLQPTDRVNSVLLNVDKYFGIHFSWNKAEQPYGFCKELADVFNLASSARRACIDGNGARRALLMREACSNVETLIRLQPLHLISELFRRFVHPGWDSTPQVRAEILRHIAREARRLLHVGHPLVAITTLLRDRSTMHDAAASTLRALSAAASRRLNRGSEDSFAVQQSIADCLIQVGVYEDAKTMCQRSLAEAESIFPAWHSVIRDIKRDRGQVSFKEGRWDEAERTWLEVTDLTIRDKGKANAGSIGLMTCECLAAMYKSRGDYVKSANYYRLALEGAVLAWGPKHVDVLEYFDCLVKVLEQEGEIDVIAGLYSEYGCVVEEWRRKEAREHKL